MNRPEEMPRDQRKILLVDDDPDVLAVFNDILQNAGYDVDPVTSLEQTYQALETGSYSLVISDLCFEKQSETGLDLLSRIETHKYPVDTILITGHSSVESAVKALKMGAYDYLTKPVDPDRLLATVARVFAFRELQRENERLRTDLGRSRQDTEFIVGSSDAMRRTMEIIRAVAPMPTSILIRGESGTGKELVADELHKLSTRASGPFIKVNCAALPDNLLEDELFGHEKGAFTGAVNRRIGRFEEADGGTVFLDEIAEMSPLLQAKLLRVLQQRCFQRVGSNTDIHVDVRVICATNKDLEHAVAEGKFREDLYYRINVVQVVLPPLRERREDIPFLAQALAGRIARKLGITNRRFTAAAIQRLQMMEFPGNVRELQNLVERVLIFCRGLEIMPEDIRPAADLVGIGSDDHRPGSTEVTGVTTDSTRTLRMVPGQSTLEEVEHEAIRLTLEAMEGNMFRAAKVLGISRSTLYSKVKKADEAQNQTTANDH